MMLDRNDPEYLREQQYRDAGNLNARIALHERFSTNTGDIHRWIFDHLLAALPAEARLVEVGCGPADLWRKNLDRLPAGWSVMLTDFSPGMLDAAKAALSGHEDQFTVEQADVQALPFADGAFDAALANFMLYHVPDRPQAIGELARVLAPGGRLFAATNGERHMAELDALLAPHVAELAGGEQSSFGLTLAFSLRNGAAQLAPFFADVALDRWPDALAVTEAEPLIAYVRSMAAGMALPPALEAGVEAEIRARIARDGAIRIGKESGLFTATKATTTLPSTPHAAAPA
ncbi:MAG TPA: class I SAM-dependent methyltransferase [Ktedonobacterales bacterium]|nr:class I SAM-dependent methyltransferase [Ktedonobacterales bacterium]